MSKNVEASAYGQKEIGLGILAKLNPLLRWVGVCLGPETININEEQKKVPPLAFEKEREKEYLEFYQQFLGEQEDLETEVVSSGENLGVQKAKFIDIQLPEHLRSEDSKELKPVFIIPAFCGDLEGVMPLVREAFLQGRRVVCLAYPESFQGNPTEEFVQAVEKTSDFSPHADYFKTSMKNAFAEEDFELWGYSTGGPISLEVMSDPEFQKRITNAVLFAPAASTTQTKKELDIGSVQAVTDILTGNLWQNLQNLSMVYAQDSELRKRVVRQMFAKICSKSAYWPRARVQRDGKIIVVSAQKDNITKSRRNIDYLETLEDRQFQNLSIPGSHLAPLFDARQITQLILTMQNKTSFDSMIIN